VQEQKLKIELELQLLRLSDESQGSPGGRASHAERSHGDEDWMHHGMSRASSVNLMEQPGTPEQREQEAASETAWVFDPPPPPPDTWDTWILSSFAYSLLPPDHSATVELR
jgi:hypothetical protein